MSDRLCAVVFVLALWWASTGLVLKAVWLGRTTEPPRAKDSSSFTTALTVSFFGVLAIGGFFALVACRDVASPFATYVSFASAIAIWGFHELTFLLGIVTGPRKLPCPPHARGWARFRFATAAVIHHEVALAATLAVIVLATRTSVNRIGMETFLVLWAMRLSAKLNVFLGVRNVTDQFVPPHLRYLLTYFRRARMNVLLPFSVLGGALVAAFLFESSVSADAEFAVVGRALVATILALAVLEHVFLAVPLPDAMLWSWLIRRDVSRPRMDESATSAPLPVDIALRQRKEGGL